MPIVKKVRKLGGRVGPGSASRDVSTLRPEFIEKRAPCSHGCPNHTDVRGVLTLLGTASARGLSAVEAFDLAFALVSERNPFAATLGLLCPHRCEDGCHRAALDGAVSINLVERLVGEHAIERRLSFPVPAERHPERIAVIGAGTAGLACAWQLARFGYAVTVFDPHPAPGGELRFADGAAAVPREVLDAEIARLVALGIDIRCGVPFADGRPVDAALGDYARTVMARVYDPARPFDAGGLAASVYWGRHQAAMLHRELRHLSPPPPEPLVVPRDRIRLQYFDPRPRVYLSGAVRPALEQGISEAARCLSCGLCHHCDNCWKFCPDQAIIRPVDRDHPYRVKLDFCGGCSKCAEECPTGFLEMR